MQHKAINLDETLDALFGDGNVAGALRLIHDSCGDGVPAAMRWRGFLMLGGQHLPRDLVGARFWLASAAKGGDEAALWAEICLSANGSGGPVDWCGAIDLLRQFASTNADARAQLDYLSGLSLDSAGYPSTAMASETICDDPHIQYIPNFCSEFECRAIVESAVDLLEISTIIDPVTGATRLDQVRTSYSATIGPTRENIIIAAVLRRISYVSKKPLANGENLVLLRYSKGQQYRPHHDTIDKSINQRELTAIIYLNDTYSGGNTIFPRIGKTITPRAGGLLIFNNLNKEGLPEVKSLHAGTPVIDGTKWIATRWIREATYQPW